MERYAKALEYHTRPDTSHKDDGVAAPSTSKSPYIHSNNTQSHSNVILEDESIQYPQTSTTDEPGNVISSNNVNELNVLNVRSSNIDVQSMICNNNVNELNVLNDTNTIN